MRFPSLPRFLVIAAWFFCAIYLAGVLGHIAGAFGHVWRIAGGILGFVLGFAGAVLLAWAAILGRLLLFYPLPPCRRGICNRLGTDYVWKKGTVYGRTSWGTYLYKCKCDETYVRKGERFMLLLPEGITIPYKRLVGFRKWADES
jgi:hypothetical protein